MYSLDNTDTAACGTYNLTLTDVDDNPVAPSDYPFMKVQNYQSIESLSITLNTNDKKQLGEYSYKLIIAMENWPRNNTFEFTVQIKSQPTGPFLVEDQTYTIGEPIKTIEIDPTILVQSLTYDDVKFETSAALVGGSSRGRPLPEDLIRLDATRHNFTVHSLDNDMAGLYLVRVTVQVRMEGGAADQRVESTFALNVIPNPKQKNRSIPMTWHAVVGKSSEFSLYDAWPSDRDYTYAVDLRESPFANYHEHWQTIFLIEGATNGI